MCIGEILCAERCRLRLVKDIRYARWIWLLQDLPETEARYSLMRIKPLTGAVRSDANDVLQRRLAIAVEASEQLVRRVIRTVQSIAFNVTIWSP